MTGHRVTWFDRPPDRPVEGNTVFVRPDLETPMPDPDVTRRPVMRDPDCGPYVTDDDGQPLEHGVGWDLSWGCRVSFSAEADGLSATVSMGEEDQRRGITDRAVTAEQVRDYAHKLLALIGDDVPREPRVWLPGATIPADVWTRGPHGDVTSYDLDEVIDPDWPQGAYVEVLVPDDDGYAAAVAAERARRAATNGEATR